MPFPIDIGGPAETLSYELSQGEAWRPETITVAVDGSGAASAFVVQASMSTAAGELLSRTRTDDSVAIGESGVATFAPF